MRFSIAAAALCMSLLAFAAVYAATSSAAPPPAPPAPAPVPAPMDSADAAAKHAKLTACLKEAKDRKLVGAAKTAFVKDCTSKP